MGKIFQATVTEHTKLLADGIGRTLGLLCEGSVAIAECARKEEKKDQRRSLESDLVGSSMSFNVNK